MEENIRVQPPQEKSFIETYYEKQVKRGLLSKQRVPFEKFSKKLSYEGFRKSYYEKQINRGYLSKDRVSFEKFSKKLGFSTTENKEAVEQTV